MAPTPSEARRSAKRRRQLDEDDDDNDDQPPPRRMFFMVFVAFFLLVGVLLMITKHVMLDRHLTSEELAKGMVDGIARDRFFHLSASRAMTKQQHYDITNTTAMARSKSGSGTGSAMNLQKQPQPQSSTAASTCQITFTPTCPISHSLLQYWEDTTDCYHSPLRSNSGLQAPLADRRYVVFQPDLGGWNNIRMALEVVILFALVSGRVLVMPPDAVLYLLASNKNWDKNKSSMDDYLDFERM